ncbi:hypothetical protein [Streptomyces sp. BK79]|uniref:hypothetical protein n=1 Tax=Streptomyces sp. BK79 TaxID=3350097 RepID=UPI00376F71D9
MCGKGPEAAAVTSLTRYTLRAAALNDPDPRHSPHRSEHGTAARPGHRHPVLHGRLRHP